MRSERSSPSASLTSEAETEFGNTIVCCRCSETTLRRTMSSPGNSRAAATPPGDGWFINDVRNEGRGLMNSPILPTEWWIERNPKILTILSTSFMDIHLGQSQARAVVKRRVRCRLWRECHWRGAAGATWKECFLILYIGQLPGRASRCQLP